MSHAKQDSPRIFGRLNVRTPTSNESTALNRRAHAPAVVLKDRHAFRFGEAYYELRIQALATLFSEMSEDQYDSTDKAQLHALVAQHVTNASRLLSRDITRDHSELLTLDLIDDLIGFGPLEHLLHRNEITDIMVIGPKLVYYEIRGRIYEAEIEFQDEAHLRSICQRIARRIGRRIDESSPMCDSRLPDGSRVNIVVPPLSIDGTALTIRKFQTQRLHFSGLVEMGALDEASVDLLKLLVRIRCNIIVVGGTGSGKTTLLNCLNQSLSSKERIVTCEDAAELQLQQRHIVRLETRTQNLEGAGEVNMRALVRNSLRMRPDRIIVGEVRGEEAFDFIQAMNTGHDGSMGTMHANSCIDALSRLEGLISLGAPSLPIRTIQQMMTSALDIIVEVRRFRDGSRRLSDILEIVGFDDQGIQTQSILEFVQNPIYDAESISGTYRHKKINSRRIRRKADHEGVTSELDRFSAQESNS